MLSRRSFLKRIIKFPLLGAIIPIIPISIDLINNEDFDTIMIPKYNSFLAPEIWNRDFARQAREELTNYWAHKMDEEILNALQK